MVVLPPPERVPEPPTDKKQVVKKVPTAKRVTPTSHHAAGHPQTGTKSNLNQPHVVAAAGDSSQGGGDSTAGTVAQGNGATGEIPTEKLPATSKPADTVTAQPSPKPVTTQPTPTPAPVVTRPTPAPVATLPKNKPLEPTPPPPIAKQQVFTEAKATQSPTPNIPDDLRTEALDKTVVAEFIVDIKGNPTQVNVVESSGNPELDQLALEAARQWRFKPATRDGHPVESTVRLHIEFQVT